MHALDFRGPQLFAGDLQALLNGLIRAASYLVAARLERIANACDVAGLLNARRVRRTAGEQLFRAAGREGHRRRRGGGLFGCFHYLAELT